MIYLVKDSVNNFVLTLNENATISNPYYLFVFQNEFNKDSLRFQWVGVDYSAFPSRYNLFEITDGEVGADADFISGQYTYTVYESNLPIVIIDQNIDYFLGLRIIEEGRMVVANGLNINTIYE